VCQNNYCLPKQNSPIFFCEVNALQQTKDEWKQMNCWWRC